MQTGLVMWTTKNQRQAITSRSTEVAQRSAGLSRTRPQFFFFVRSRKSGHGSSSSRNILSETNSGEVRHSSKTSNSNWKRQPELYQIEPKPSHAQEEQTHWDKISLHSGHDGRRDYFNSLRSYRQNGTGNLKEILPESKVKTFRTVLMRTDSTQSAQVGVGVLDYSHERSEN